MDTLTQYIWLRVAVKQLGGEGRLARRLGISRQAVHQWKRCPKRKVLEVEGLSGVSRHKLRPDIHPPQTERVWKSQ